MAKRMPGKLRILGILFTILLTLFPCAHSVDLELKLDAIDNIYVNILKNGHDDMHTKFHVLSVKFHSELKKHGYKFGKKDQLNKLRDAREISAEQLCHLWHIWKKEEQKRNDQKAIAGDSETKSFREEKAQIECKELEAHLRNESGPEEKGHWVNEFLRDLQKAHFDQLRQLFGEDESPYAKGDPRNVFKRNRVGKESMLAWEMRKWHLDLAEGENRANLMGVKGRMVKLMGDQLYNKLEELYPIAMAIDQFDETMLTRIYASMFKIGLDEWEPHLSSAYYFGRIWSLIVSKEKMLESKAKGTKGTKKGKNKKGEGGNGVGMLVNNSRKVGALWSRVIEKQFTIYQGLPWDIFLIWVELCQMGEFDGERKCEDARRMNLVELEKIEGEPKRTSKERSDLLWKEHWESLKKLSKMPEKFGDRLMEEAKALDKDGKTSPMIRGFWGRMADFFGGFDEILQKMELEGEECKNAIAKMFTPIKLSERIIDRKLEDKFKYILMYKQEENRDKYMQAKIGIDIQLYMEWLNKFIAEKMVPLDLKIMEKWEFASLELNVFLDGLRDKKSVVWLDAPAYTLLKWLHKLKSKCEKMSDEKGMITEWDMIGDIKMYKKEIKEANERDAKQKLALGAEIELELEKMRAAKMHELIDGDNHVFVENLKDMFNSKDSSAIRDRFCTLFGTDKNGNDENVKKIIAKIGVKILKNTEEKKESGKELMREIMDANENILATMFKAYLNISLISDTLKIPLEKYKEELASKWGRFGTVKAFLEKLNAKEYESVREMIALEGIHWYYRVAIREMLLFAEQYANEKKRKNPEVFQLVSRLKQDFLELIKRSGFDGTTGMICKLHTFLWTRLHVKLMEMDEDKWKASVKHSFDQHIYQLSNLPKYISDCSEEDQLSILKQLEGKKKQNVEIHDKEIDAIEVERERKVPLMLAAKKQMILRSLVKFVDEIPEFKAFIEGHENDYMMKERLFELFGIDGLDYLERRYPSTFKFELLIHHMSSHYYKTILNGENEKERKRAEVRLGLTMQYADYLVKQRKGEEEAGGSGKFSAVYIQGALAWKSVMLAIYPTGLAAMDYENQLRGIKLFNDSRELAVLEVVKEGIMAKVKKLKMVPFGEVAGYEEEALEKQRAYLADAHFKYVLTEMMKDDEFCRILREQIGAPYRLDQFLGESKLEGGRRLIEKVYFHVKMGDVKNVDVYKKVMQNAARVQDPMFFENDNRLLLHYSTFLNTYHNNVLRLQHGLAANIVAWMRDFNRTILNSTSLNAIYKKYKRRIGQLDQLRLRIEYDKVLTAVEDERELYKLAYIHRELLGKIKNFPNTISTLDEQVWMDSVAEQWLKVPERAKKSGEKKYDKNSGMAAEPWPEMQEMHFSMFQFLFEKIDINKNKEEEVERKKWEIVIGENIEEKRKEEERKKGEERERKDLFSKWVKIFSDVHTGEEVIKKRLLSFLSIDGIKKIMKTYFGYEIDELDYMGGKAKADEKPEVESPTEKKKKKARKNKKEEQLTVEDDQSQHSGENSESGDTISSDTAMDADEGSSFTKLAKKGGAKKKKERKLDKNIIIAQAQNIEQYKSKKELGEIMRSKNLLQFDEKHINIALGGASLKDFTRRLPSKYLEFIAHSSSAERLFLLDIGSLAGEIGRRFSVVNEMKKKFADLYYNLLDWSVLDMLEAYWDEVREELEEARLRWNVVELETIEFKLLRILKALISRMENYAKLDDEFVQDLDIDGLNEEETNEKIKKGRANGLHLKSQLHLNNLAKLLAQNEDYEEEWQEIDEERRERLILLFYGIDMDEVLGKEENEEKRKELEREVPKKRLKEFEKKYLNGWKKLYEQQKIDTTLYDEYSQQAKKFALMTHLDMGVNEFLQHYTLSEKGTIDEFKVMTNGLANEIGYSEMNDEESGRRKQIDEAIENLGKIVSQWGNQYAKMNGKVAKAVLFEGGAYQLGTLTVHSNIELKVISAQLGYDKFFGTETCIIDRRICANSSLYCKLCTNDRILKLSKSPTSLIPVIAFSYCPKGVLRATTKEECVEFELSLVAIPGQNEISEDLLTNIGELQKKFLKEGEKLNDMEWGDPRFAMIDLLSSHRFNMELLNRYITHRTARKNFRITLMAMEIWTKNHHINSRSFGHLNRMVLTILVAKIALRHPSASVPFLLEQIFLTCLIWPWPVPIQLKELSSGSSLAVTNWKQIFNIAWNAQKELNSKANMFIPEITAEERQPNAQGRHMFDLAMPFIKPGFPEDNAAFTMNQSTMEIVRREMAEGLRDIRSVRIGEKGWKQFLEGDRPFPHKYGHFILITCRLQIIDDTQNQPPSGGGADDAELFDKFCASYVNHRIRLNLIFHVERKNGIRLCHLTSLESANGRGVEEMGWKIKDGQKDGGGGVLVKKLDGLKYLVKKWLVGVDTAGHPLPFAYHQLNNELNGSYGFIDEIRGKPAEFFRKTRIFENLNEREKERKFSRLKLSGQFISQNEAKDLF